VASRKMGCQSTRGGFEGNMEAFPGTAGGEGNRDSGENEEDHVTQSDTYCSAASVSDMDDDESNHKYEGTRAVTDNPIPVIC
jgi:hypothetical protein